MKALLAAGALFALSVSAAAGWLGSAALLHRDAKDAVLREARQAIPVGTMPSTGAAVGCLGRCTRELRSDPEIDAAFGRPTSPSDPPIQVEQILRLLPYPPLLAELSGPTAHLASSAWWQAGWWTIDTTSVRGVDDADIVMATIACGESDSYPLSFLYRARGNRTFAGDFFVCYLAVTRFDAADAGTTDSTRLQLLFYDWWSHGGGTNDGFIRVTLFGTISGLSALITLPAIVILLRRRSRSLRDRSGS